MRIQCISRPRSTWSLPTIGNVVLRLAGDDAGLAADAGVQVDRHAPLVQAVELRRRVERVAAGDVRGLLGRRQPRAGLVVGRTVRLEADGGDKRGVRLELLDVGLADDVAALHRPVLLGVGEGLRRPGTTSRVAPIAMCGAPPVRSA